MPSSSTMSGIDEPRPTTLTDWSTSTCPMRPSRAHSCHVSSGQQSGVLHGHDGLRHFFLKGTAGRPNELVRWYRTGRHIFDGCTLIWEYPRQAPEFEQVDLVEVMELAGPRIARHRIYWGWFGTLLLERHR